ncbi:MAG: hypothetical protein RIF41_25450 [Polyangiaceae bacterium]
MSRPTDRPRHEPPRFRTLAVGLAVVFASGQLLACATAGANKDATEPNEPPTDLDLDRATADQAEAKFEAAEEDLQRLMVTKVEKSAEGEDATTDDDGEQRPAPAPPATQQERRYEASSKAARCDRACAALGSMQRSAARLCELTGDGDARCQSVRVRVESAEELVRRFCPACSS